MTTINFPSFAYIVAIDLGQRTIVTFSDEHLFTLGEIVSFRITKPYGTVELNNVHAKVIALDDTSITVDYDSSNFTPFIYPVSGKNSPPVVVPSSSGVLSDLYTPEYTLEDSFDRRNV